MVDNVQEQTRTTMVRQTDRSVGYIVVVDGEGRGERVEFNDKPTLVGTHESTHLRLADPAVSRFHFEAELLPPGNHVRIRDQNSKNGTWSSGIRVLDAEVRPGTHITVGKTVLEVGAETLRRDEWRWTGGSEFHGVYGKSALMQQLFVQLELIEGLDDPVVLQGPIGTEMEEIARAMHSSGPRKDGPFAVLSSSELGGTLSDLELFGCVRGAFTGATEDRKGVFERAEGGTLFIDEIGELPLSVQPKLLRALESHTVRRLGAESETRVDVRLIAATRRSLPALVNEGAFRGDLYHRMSTYVLRVPPLRDRGADIAALAQMYLAGLNCPPGAKEQLEAYLTKMKGYQWPANLIELRNHVRRLALLGDPTAGETYLAEAGPPRVDLDLPFSEGKKRWVEIFERQYLTQLLDEVGGNVTQAAQRAGMDRSHLGQMARKLGIRGGSKS